MCHYFVRIKLKSAIISRWCDSHEKYPHIHLPACVPTHTNTRTHVCLLPIWTPDLFQPSDSHWHLPLERSLLTCWSWWEWMMLLLEEKKEGRKNGLKWGGGGGCRAVWGWMKGGVWGIGKLPTRPLESIWTPLPAERSQAAWALYPPYKGAIALTRESSAAIWLHCPVIPPVIYQKRPWSSCRIRAVSCSPVIDAGIKLCIKWAVAGGAPSLSLKTVDGMEGCSWFSAALRKGKAGYLLLYRGSLLVAERGTARWRRNTCAFKNSKHVI